MDSSSDSECDKETDHEQTINSLTEEIEELKQQLEESDNKCFAAEKLFELKQKDDGNQKLDEENRRVKEQLKWKMEQFQHLAEAHEKLKDEFQKSSKNWDVARSVLVDEVSEMKTRDEEIANLKSLLQEKEAMCKEYEYMSRKIEQENQELMTTIKELQEAQIQGANSSSSSTLARVKSKLKNVEQKHKAREAEWSCKLEKLADELSRYPSIALTWGWQRWFWRRRRR